MGERVSSDPVKQPQASEDQFNQRLLSEVFGDNAHRINNLFTCMEIAEEVIAEAQAEYLEKATEIYDSFKSLKPSPLLQFSRHQNLQLYRHHAQELVKRIIQDDDIKPATSAELASVFCEISLTYPLNHIQVELMKSSAVCEKSLAKNDSSRNCHTKDAILVMRKGIL